MSRKVSFDLPSASLLRPVLNYMWPHRRKVSSLMVFAKFAMHLTRLPSLLCLHLLDYASVPRVQDRAGIPLAQISAPCDPVCAWSVQ